MKKRIFALLTVLVLVLSLSATALAAKPSAKLYGKYKNQTVARGEVIRFLFKLKSGSYKQKDGAFRAKIDVVISKDSKDIGKASWAYTGSQKYTCRAKIKKDAALGKYTMTYTTYYRKSGSDSWKKAKSGSTGFTVK